MNSDCRITYILDGLKIECRQCQPDFIAKIKGIPLGKRDFNQNDLSWMVGLEYRRYVLLAAAEYFRDAVYVVDGVEARIKRG